MFECAAKNYIKRPAHLTVTPRTSSIKKLLHETEDSLAFILYHILGDQCPDFKLLSGTFMPGFSYCEQSLEFYTHQSTFVPIKLKLLVQRFILRFSV